MKNIKFKFYSIQNHLNLKLIFSEHLYIQSLAPPTGKLIIGKLSEFIKDTGPTSAMQIDCRGWRHSGLQKCFHSSRRHLQGSEAERITEVFHDWINDRLILI